MASYFTLLAMFGVLVQIRRYTDLGIILYILVSAFALGAVATMIEPIMGTKNATILLYFAILLPEARKILRYSYKKYQEYSIFYHNKTTLEKYKTHKMLNYFFERILPATGVSIYFIALILSKFEIFILEPVERTLGVNGTAGLILVFFFSMAIGTMFFGRKEDKFKKILEKEEEKEESDRLKAKEEAKKRAERDKKTRELERQKAQNREKEFQLEDQKKQKEKVQRKTDSSIEEIKKLLDD